MAEHNGNGTDAETATSGALMRRDQLREKTDRNRRDTYVGPWRFVLKLTEAQIVSRLAKLDPPTRPVRGSWTTALASGSQSGRTLNQHAEPSPIEPYAVDNFKTPPLSMMRRKLQPVV